LIVGYFGYPTIFIMWGENTKMWHPGHWYVDKEITIDGYALSKEILETHKIASRDICAQNDKFYHCKPSMALDCKFGDCAHGKCRCFMRINAYEIED
jgi:hypothetical protein